MKKRLLSAVLTLIVLTLSMDVVFSQIVSEGATPVGLRGGLRTVVELPKSSLGRFDRDSALMALQRHNDDRGLMRDYLFAIKETAEVDLIKAGGHFTDGGREVWQYRVTSKGAQSLSFFFDHFYLPSGAFLSVYSSSDPSVAIGPFGAENNNAHQALSTVPILADDVILEVVAPRGTTPIVSLSEVNTGLLNVFDAFEGNTFPCSPDVACMPQVSDVNRSIVVVIVNGVALGTGTLVNTPKNDGAPLILTASHVMSHNFRYRDYVRRATKTVVVFNYHSPICGDGIQPSVSQALSGATLVGVDEKTDFALIRMGTPPPASYGVYYSGWSAEDSPKGPFMNLHHPKVQPTKYNQYDGDLRYVSFPDTGYPFGKDLYYEIPAWTIGTTAPASSGSPLLDNEKQVIGALTGGGSACGLAWSDYFSSLHKLWERASTSEDARKIVEALTGGNVTLLSQSGREATGELFPGTSRVSHISLSEAATTDIPSRLKSLSKEKIMSYTDVAERYDLNDATILYGVYLLFKAEKSPYTSEIKTPLTLTISNANSGQEITHLPVPMETLTAPSHSDGLREIFLPLPEPLTATGVTPLLFGLNTAGMPDNGIIATQTEFTPTAFGKNGSSGYEPISPNTNLWVDLLISDKKLTETSTPFVRIVAGGDEYLVFSFDPKYAKEKGTLNIYTIIGQRVGQFGIQNGYLLLPKSAVRGLGVLLFRIKLGDRTETLKVLITD